jgi:hypothetical protein
MDIVAIPASTNARPTLNDSARIPSAAAAGLTVIAVYGLSEAGRKASLITGGDGRAHQRLSVQVPPARLHLVSVDANGIARLKLPAAVRARGGSGRATRRPAVLRRPAFAR